MSTFVPLVAVPGARRVGEAGVTLPDPHPATSGVSRFPTQQVVLLEVAPETGSLDVRAPADAALRMVDVPPSLAGISALLEISPLPFAEPMRRVLAALPGLPTFYVGLPSAVVGDPASDVVVRAGSVLGTLTAGQSAFVGIVFQDGASLAPARSIELIGNAVAVVESAASWRTQLQLFPAVDRHVFVLDAAGALHGPITFAIRLRDAGGAVLGSWERSLPAGQHDLEAVVAADPLGALSSLFAAPSGQTLELQPTAIPGGPPEGGPFELPVQALLETAAGAAAGSTPPGGWLAIPAAPTRLHLQVLDLGRWFPPGPANASVERFRIDSRIEPFVDGIPTYQGLAEDLRAARQPGCGLHAAGWAFNRFPLDADHETDGSDDFVDYVRKILDAGGSVRVLAAQLINLNQAAFADDTRLLFSLILVLLSDFALIKSAWNKLSRDDAGFAAIGFGALLTALGEGYLLGRVRALMDEFLEEAVPLVPVLNAQHTGDGAIALKSPYPARLRDNPLYDGSLILGLQDDVDHFGVWHNKAQAVKLPRAGGGFQYVAWVGGIDINFDRIDTPAHGVESPFHDVHSRLTGPAVIDVFKSFEERYAFDAARTPGALPLEITTPTLAEAGSDPARHIVRIGRTYFGPNPDGASDVLPFARDGERSIYDTVLAAIGRARRYIYLEDQYYTPPGSAHPPKLDEISYQAAILGAAATCQRLVITVPSGADLPWGDRRRRRLFADLRDAWGERVQVGFLQCRPRLARASRVANVGRSLLYDEITSPAQTQFRIGAAARLATPPYWIWIDGELMLVSSADADAVIVDGVPVKRVTVVRAELDPAARRWGATPRTHKKGAPVTHATLRTPYVHAKVMIIDDVFVSIGTANLNRRGFLHDGEIQAFAIPQQLAAATDNPARALRTALWAEHLGIAPEMGAAVLRDPLAAFELFRRSQYLGNRYTQFDALDISLILGVPDGTSPALAVLEWVGLTAIEQIGAALWDKVFDPTSFVDRTPIVEQI